MQVHYPCHSPTCGNSPTTLSSGQPRIPTPMRPHHCPPHSPHSTSGVITSGVRKMMRPALALPGGARAAAPSGAWSGSFAAPPPDPTQGVMVWSGGRMPHALPQGQLYGPPYGQPQGPLHGQPQGQLHPHGQLAAPPPRAKSADAPIARRAAAAPVAYAPVGVGAGVGAGVRVFRPPVHRAAEQPPRQQPPPATQPTPPKLSPAAVVQGDARLPGVVGAGFAEPMPRTTDAPEALQKRLRPAEPPSSGAIAIGSAPAATRCRSG